MLEEYRLGGRHVVFRGVGDEPFECDGGIDDEIDQRRPRFRASSASAVDIGVRRSALRNKAENARRLAGSSMGRRTRRASARAARRRNELRVSPAFRAAASMTRRSVSGSETRTLGIAAVYPPDIRNRNVLRMLESARRIRTGGRSDLGDGRGGSFARFRRTGDLLNSSR